MNNDPNQEQKSALDSITGALDQISNVIDEVAGKVGDAIEEKYDELKKDEKIGGILGQAEDLLDKLKDKAEELKDSILGETKTETEAEVKTEEPAAPDSPDKPAA
ncbi:MAG: hypothetical protein EAZ89_16195 [Bacteroidetes bacterium]|nr:MAG: hypothetical protein EAZ89_16195 [Bacteroidota bacterium]